MLRCHVVEPEDPVVDGHLQAEVGPERLEPPALVVIPHFEHGRLTGAAITKLLLLVPSLRTKVVLSCLLS